MSAILTLEHVCKTFGSHPVVQDLSFSVEPGEVFGFLGPNGAGTTTTIKIILGLLHMDSGSILIDGHSVEDDFAAAMAHVSGIVEHPDMYKYLSGYDNLLLQAHACGADRAQIDRVVEMVGMQARIRDKFKTYSLGMKQRLGVAQALLHDPKLMILDEPTNGLDPAGIKDFRDLIRRLAHENGIAVLVSSHILQEMQLMCDRVGIIDRGTLKQISSVEELTHQSTRYRFTVRPIGQAAALLQQHVPDRLAAITDTYVELAVTEDELPIITQKLVENGIQLYGVQPVGNQLEDSFIQITGGGNTLA